MSDRRHTFRGVFRMKPIPSYWKTCRNVREELYRTMHFFLRGAGRLGFIENACLPTACSVYQRFANTVQPGDEYRIVYHGTTPDAVPSILCCGFDVKSRSGQEHDPRECFAGQPEMLETYSRDSGRLMVCALVDQPSFHTGSNIFLVDNCVNQLERAFVLPLGVAVFRANGSSFPHRCTNPPVPSLRQMHDAVRVLIHREGQGTDLLPRVEQIDAKLATFERVLSVTKPTREFLSINDLKINAGHWFKCSKGHLYVTAAKGSRCTDCDEPVVVNCHRIISTNSNAASDVVYEGEYFYPSRS